MFKVKKFKGKRRLFLWGTITNIEISYQVANGYMNVTMIHT